MKLFNNTNDASRSLNYNGIEVENLKPFSNWILPTPSSNWNWFNQGGARVTDFDAKLAVYIPPQANRLRGMTKSLPQTFDFDFQLVCNSLGGYDGATGWDFGAVLVAGTEAILFSNVWPNGGFVISYYSGFNSAPLPIFTSLIGTYEGFQYLRFFDDSVNLNYMASPNGVDWLTIYSEVSGSTISPTRAGFAGDARLNSDPCLGTVFGAGLV